MTQETPGWAVPASHQVLTWELAPERYVELL